jgi:hypothetical protein
MQIYSQKNEKYARKLLTSPIFLAIMKEYGAPFGARSQKFENHRLEEIP